ncbi:MAG: hypothetical protein ACLU86_01350 [Negativibacillus massiliensis]|uniref:hypothetical protein n=1 Tax=Negativibacillus massiliensis TaxID=1871035 RepID=UPI00399C173B
MKKLFITLLAALTLFAAVPQMCFAEEPTTPPTVEQGEGDEQTPPVPVPSSVNGPMGDNN